MQLPLPVPESNENITREWIKTRTSAIGSFYIWAHRGNGGSDDEELMKKMRRVRRAFRKNAMNDGYCYFCFKSVEHIQTKLFADLPDSDHNRTILFACPRCTPLICDSYCLGCGAEITDLKENFWLCLTCLSALDESASKDNYKSLRSQLDTQGALTNLNEAHDMGLKRCLMCEEQINKEISWGYCPTHHEVVRNAERYRRYLQKKGFCPNCETDLPAISGASKEYFKQDTHDICPNCKQTVVELGYSWEYCPRCKTQRTYTLHGNAVRVRFPVCAACYINQAEEANDLEEFRSQGESIILEYARQLYPDDVVAPNAHPPWLDGLELDVYIPDQRLAFEYDGEQHFAYIPIWHGSPEGFEAQQERDQQKNRLCKRNGVCLIRFRYDEPLSWDHFNARVSESIIN